jgi:hypothetical protein
MAIAYVQGIGKGVSTGGVGAQTVTFDAPLTLGNLIVMGHVGNSESVTFSITNNGDGVLSWQTVGPIDHTTATARGYLWYADVTEANVTTVTINRSSGTATIVLSGAEFSGVANASPFVDSDTGETTSATSHDVASGVAVAGDALLFGVCGSTTAAVFTQGANFTLIDTIGSLGTQYRIVGSAATYTSPMSSAAGETAVIIMAAFNAEPGANTSISPNVGNQAITGQAMSIGLTIGMPSTP